MSNMVASVVAAQDESNMGASAVAVRDVSNNLPPPASGRGERERSKESSSLEDGESNNAFLFPRRG